MLALHFALTVAVAGSPLLAAQVTGGSQAGWTPVERSAVEQLGEAFATHYPLRDGWYKGRAVQWYDLGRTEPQAGTLYRVRGGGEVFSTIPGVGGYSVVRRVYEVEVVAGGVEPVAVRSAAVIRALARRGQVRVVGTGQMVLAVVVPAGSTLEHDPAGRRLRPAWYRGVAVWYWGFGPARAAAQDAVWGGGEAAVLLTRVPGEAGYTDLCAVWAGEWGGRAYRDAQRALADGRAGRVVVRRRGQVRACPVMYVDGAPAARAERVAPRQPAVAAPTNGPSLEAGNADATMGVYSGGAGQTDVRAPQLGESITVDGLLDESVWAQASLLTGFSQFSPLEGRPAEDSTQVLIWYSESAIHFGIRAFAPTGTIRATLADRDKIDNDDYIQILLDTFNDRRQALTFGVNPLGAQADGIRNEGGSIIRVGGSGGGGGGNQVGFARGLDLSPDFVYDSKGRLTDYGYEVEVRIPFKSFRFQSRAAQDWGINILRKVQRSGYEDTWTRTGRTASFLSQSGRLRDLTGLSRGLVLDINPVVTARVDGEPSATGTGWQYDELGPDVAELGGNIRWGVTTNLTMNGTVNPDFSQVEADAARIPIDPRFAIFFPEKRPFFVEGIEQLSSPGQLIYTRRVTNPVGAVKLTGKAAGTTIGLLSAVDAKNASETLVDNPIYNLVRLRRDLAGQSTVGLTYTDKIDGRDFNRVAAFDARIVFKKLYFIQLQAGQSFTRRLGSIASGPIWDLWADRTGRSWGFRYQVKGFHPDFVAASGFVRRVGFVSADASNRFSLFGQPGGVFESWTGRVNFSGTWDYHQFFGGGKPIETRISFNNTFAFKGGWSLSVNPITETFEFDSTFHAGYAVEQVLAGGAVDTVPFVLDGQVRSLGFIASLRTPKFSQFSATARFIYGQDIDHFEFAPAPVIMPSFTIEWRPTEQIRIDAQYLHRRLRRKRDGSTFATAHVPRLKIEYQLARPLFVRFVGQYDARTRDALRDPRTEDPILVDGTLTTREVTNDFRYDVLLALQPNPGTVFFAGYGSSLTETDALAFRDLRRVNDNFFMKLSYLFRM